MAKINKFRAKRISYEDKVFDSKTEYQRYLCLREREERGEISGPCHHTRFLLRVAGVPIGYYESDYTYYLKTRDGTISSDIVVEDVKSPFTAKLPMYRWKVRHLFAEYGIVVQEVYMKKIGRKNNQIIQWESKPAKIPKALIKAVTNG